MFAPAPGKLQSDEGDDEKAVWMRERVRDERRGAAVNKKPIST